jgi:hypothetical protein
MLARNLTKVVVKVVNIYHAFIKEFTRVVYPWWRFLRYEWFMLVKFFWSHNEIYLTCYQVLIVSWFIFMNCCTYFFTYPTVVKYGIWDYLIALRNTVSLIYKVWF